jgi:hypothetical protein
MSLWCVVVGDQGLAPGEAEEFASAEAALEAAVREALEQVDPEDLIGTTFAAVPVWVTADGEWRSTSDWDPDPDGREAQTLVVTAPFLRRILKTQGDLTPSRERLLDLIDALRITVPEWEQCEWRLTLRETA